MPKYRARTIVAAEQWFPGRKIPGVVAADDGTMAIFAGTGMVSESRWRAIVPGDYIVNYDGGFRNAIEKAQFEAKYEYIGGE